MTKVIIDIRQSQGNSEKDSPSGYIRWRSFDRETDSGVTRLPADFKVELVRGVASVVVPGGYWRVTEIVLGGTDRTVLVPDTDNVKYSDLLEVDPKTLASSTEAQSNWSEVAAEVKEYYVLASRSATSAVQAAAWAEESEKRAREICNCKDNSFTIHSPDGTSWIPEISNYGVVTWNKATQSNPED